MEWIAANARELIDAEYCLNTDAGSGLLVNGRPQLLELQAAEKVYQTYRLEVTNPGGHSSLPRKDNAIYQLAAALGKLAAFQFPVQLTDVSREYFARSGRIHQGQLGADMRAIAEHPDDVEAAGRLSQSPLYNSMLRTTCVATRLEAGHADNALPQRADATVNCRILPGVEPSSVRDALARAIADPAVTITSTYDAQPSPPSPLRPEITGVIEQLVREQWNVPTVPTMETGATDGLYLRNAGIPTYGVGALFEDPNDIRSHGRDERIDPRWFFQAVAFWDRMVRELAGGTAGATSTGR
jgi:acetylornithine deacetylase/succinyl-diaminopimelate desuccinylase-like protein